MAFCEVAQRECDKLGVIRNYLDDTTLFRATTEREDISAATERIADSIEEVLVNTQATCSDKFCGLEGLTVLTAVKLAAEDLRDQRREDELKELGDI